MTFIITLYKQNMEASYIDTDSYTHRIDTDDFYKDIPKIINYFDTCWYSEDNEY